MYLGKARHAGEWNVHRRKPFLCPIAVGVLPRIYRDLAANLTVIASGPSAAAAAVGATDSRESWEMHGEGLSQAHIAGFVKVVAHSASIARTMQTTFRRAPELDILVGAVSS